jgi:hypothetical protein
VWCGACYTPHPLDRFHVNTPKDEDGFEWLSKPSDAFRYKQARNGDQLITPFQCEWCLFRLLTGTIPNLTRREDTFLMCLLRRANLDAFWGRETNTVLANRRNLDQLLRLWYTATLREPCLPSVGPFPTVDVFGVTVAVAMLVKSLEPGRYKDYSQFETMRKLRSAFSNLYHASLEGSTSRVALGQNSSKTFLSACPTHSLWFERFSRGCLLRMGQVVKQDLAISIRVMLALLEVLEQEWRTADEHKKQSIAIIGAFICIAYAGSFRGNEVFLVDLFGLIKYSQKSLQEGGVKYVIIPLLGRFKGEEGERYHLTPLAYRSDSGINIGVWVERLVWTKQLHKQSHGPAFSDRSGKLISSNWIEMEILDRLHEIQTTNPEIISQDVNVYEDFGISRSFRRGATTQARNKGVQENDIDAMNRWRSTEQAKGRKPRLKMQDHYSDIQQMVPTLLRFSKAL